MGEHTKRLLEECSKGCQMAVESIEQLQNHISDRKMQELAERYRQKHAELERETASLLAKEGAPEPPAGMVASAMSRITSGVRLMMDESAGQVAKLLMDGCNMGVQTITEAANRYTEASRESRALAEKLVKTEEQFSKELKTYL